MIINFLSLLTTCLMIIALWAIIRVEKPRKIVPITLVFLLIILNLILLNSTEAESLKQEPNMNNKTNKAMTWTTLQLVKTWNGTNYYALVGSDIKTNPYEGDTLITETLPILCIKKQNLPKPDFVISHQTPGGASRSTWSEGYIGLTKPIKGTDITNITIANNICRETFGQEFRMAEFHDGEGSNAGWDFWGELVEPNISLQDRFWVAINDQLANPWSKLRDN